MENGISFKAVTARAIALRATELALLVLALYFTIQGLSPVGDAGAQYMPNAAFAIVCFGISRLLAWRRAKDNPFPIMLEIVAFALFVRFNFSAALAL